MRSRWSVPAAVIVTIAVAAAGAYAPAAVAGLLAVALLMIVACWRPQVGISVWLITTILVPSWTVIEVGGTPVGPSYLAIPVIVAVAVRLIHNRISHGDAFELSAIDFGVFAGVVLVVSYQSLFEQASFLSTNVVVTLFGGYVLGRFAKSPLHRTFAILMVILAVWGLSEFLFSWHAFTGWQADAGGMGPALQERGGLARSEASLGHAIAYGACLAAALPFVNLFKRPVIFQLIVAAGVLVSFSRGPILAIVFTFGILVFVEKSAKRRFSSLVLLVAGLAVAYFVFSLLYTGAGQSDVTSSEQERDRQLSLSMQYTNLFGPADGTQMNFEGQYVTNGVELVDSAPLRLALDFGWVACALLLLPMLAVIIQVLRRRAGPATVALAGQIPILLVTSFITQWQTVIYFLAGMAVNEMIQSRQASRNGRAQQRPQGLLTPVEQQKSTAAP